MGFTQHEKEDIHVEVKNNQLTISGERNTKEEVKKEDYCRMETCYGKFERSFTLSDQVDGEKISARCEDGVLEVVISKLLEANESKKVEVHKSLFSIH